MIRICAYSIITSIFLLLCACSRPNHQAQGYMEGKYTYIATSVSGVLEQLLVAKGDWVEKGQTLFVLEAQPESDSYEAAAQNLKESIAYRDSIIANLAYAKITYERYKTLVPKNAIDQASLDNAMSTYQSTQAQLTQANATIASSAATLAQAKWTKEQKSIAAPIGGIVFDTFYRLGEYTQANQAILSLLAPENIKAIFYVPAEDLSYLKLRKQISVRCDNCKESYTGTISFISPSAEYTPPVIYSNETNDKLIFRIEAVFAPKDAINLHPGQPVYVTYSTYD